MVSEKFTHAKCEIPQLELSIKQYKFCNFLPVLKTDSSFNNEYVFHYTQLYGDV